MIADRRRRAKASLRRGSTGRKPARGSPDSTQDRCSAGDPTLGCRGAAGRLPCRGRPAPAHQRRLPSPARHRRRGRPPWPGATQMRACPRSATVEHRATRRPDAPARRVRNRCCRTMRRTRTTGRPAGDETAPAHSLCLPRANGRRSLPRPRSPRSDRTPRGSASRSASGPRERVPPSPGSCARPRRPGGLRPLRSRWTCRGAGDGPSAGGPQPPLSRLPPLPRPRRTRARRRRGRGSAPTGRLQPARS